MKGSASKKYYLAIDVGASSGRHMVGWISDGKLMTEEIYRFENWASHPRDIGSSKKPAATSEGVLAWDIDYLTRQVIAGLKKCKEVGKIPEIIGIDTWGVDYVLLNENGEAIMPIHAYRDIRNVAAANEAENVVPFEKLYARTGIQKVVLNTVYQLCKDRNLGRLNVATQFLMVPEYFNYVLTGKRMREFTNCSTTSLLKLGLPEWDWGIIDSLGLPRKIFEGNVHMPGTLVGTFTPSVKEEVGFDAKVVLVASHDTGSAVLGAPIDENGIYLSSGTWSLIGVETKGTICNEESMLFNFTNEGGYQNRNRFLRNIMGLWILQNVREELSAAAGKNVTFKEVASMAKRGKPVGLFDVDDQRFFSPGDMLKKIREILKVDEQATIPDLVRSIYASLAESYRAAVEHIEHLTNKRYETIYIIGGGSKDDLLNELTKKATGKRVVAGPSEATAVGNLMAVMAVGEGYTDVRQMRDLIRKSLQIKEVE